MSKNTEPVQYFRIKNWDKYQKFKFKQSWTSQQYVLFATSFLDDPKTCHLSEHLRLSWVVLMLLAGRHQNRLRYDSGWCQAGGRLRKPVDLALFESLGLIEKVGGGGIIKDNKIKEEEESKFEKDDSILSKIPPPKKMLIDQITQLWNAQFQTKIKGFFFKRLDLLNQAISNHPNLNYWKTCFEKVKASDFLNSEKKWKTTLDWVMEHHIEIMEGKYDNQGNTSTHKAAPLR